MPSLIKVARVARLATLPETRRLMTSTIRSGALGDVVRRARTDRLGLVHDLGDPRTAAARLRRVLGHPATRELANVGLLFVPGRYLALGWAAARASRRMSNRGR